jgi:RNA polymerase sigma-70 factor (ECF subfamily)
MSDAAFFRDMIRRVRAGDPEAARELFVRFEPQLRLEVSLRLRDPRLRRRVDESDICQSVLLSFFVRVRLGQYEVDEPGNLANLLAVMARKKVAAQARRHGAARRDFRRVGAVDPADCGAADGGATPSQVVTAEELVREFRARLTEEERRLADLRAAGRR